MVIQIAILHKSFAPLNRDTEKMSLVFVGIDTVPLGIVGLHPELSKQVNKFISLQRPTLVGICLLEEGVGGLLGYIECLHHGLQLVNADSSITVVVLKNSYLNSGSQAILQLLSS